MTEEQVIKYIIQKDNILPVIQAGSKYLTPKVQKARAQHNVRFLSILLQVPNLKIEQQVTLSVIKSDPYSIKYMKNPSQRLQLMAVTEDGFAIQYIDNPSQQVKFAALKNDPRSIQFIKNPTREMKKYAINRNPFLIVIEDPQGKDQELCLLAINNEPLVIQNINNATQKMVKAALRKDGRGVFTSSDILKRFGVDKIKQWREQARQQNRLQDLRGIDKE